MRNLVNRGPALWLFLGLVCALPAAAAGPEPEAKRWVPALAVFGDVLVQQTEKTGENGVDLSASGDDLRVLALVATSDEVITLLVPEGESGHWVAEIAVPGETLVQQAGGGERGTTLPGVSDEALVATPVVVAAAEPVTPAAASDSDGIVEPIPPGQPDQPDSQLQAATEEKPKDETERWVPAFSFYSGVLVQDAEGEASSTLLTGPGAPSPLDCLDGTTTNQVRCPASGDDLMLTPFVAGSVELMTPGLTSVPGRPRLFVHGDAAASFAFTRDLAKESIPGEFEVTGGVKFPTETSILGQGTTTSAEVKPLLLSAGAGVAFTVDAWERRLRIKPSVEYLREEIEVTGVMHRAVEDGTVADPITEDFPDGFRLIELSGSDKRSFHGIGPGLEVEADAARAGPLMLTVYIAGQAYAFLGDLEMEFSDTNEFGETATWSFEKNRWAFRGGVGLRFRWVPE